MRARLGWMLAYFALLVAAAPTGSAQVPAAAPIALKPASADSLTAAAPARQDAEHWPPLVYSFCAQPNCTDGANPVGGLITDAAGNLYGATNGGGARSGGVVYMLKPIEGKNAWTQIVLHDFCNSSECIASGAYPQAGVIMDEAGNLYGTTSGGGGAGVVFQLTPDSTRTTWQETILHAFCAPYTNCPDGAAPYAALIMDASGNLYGTTVEGGGHDSGVVFKLAPNQSRTAWTYSVLYSFCSQVNCVDGAFPVSGVIADSAGNLYGTTLGYGGGWGAGVVYQLAPNQNQTAWAYTVIQTFCTPGNCPPGGAPGGLVLDQAGNLYGVVNGQYDSNGFVFRLAPNDTHTSWTATILYSFCQQNNCADGVYPDDGLAVDGQGNLYATTELGGDWGKGTLFRLSPAAAQWSLSTLYSFCRFAGCRDGFKSGLPSDGHLLMAGAGTLYSTRFYGGWYGWGAVFSFNLNPTNNLSVTESGPGRVTSSPAGIDCRNSCGAKFAPGTAVTLTAIPDAGASFTGWAKDCSGTGSCIVTLDSDRAVYAVFEAAQPALSVSTIGSGMITASDAGINCGGTCSARLPRGSTVTLSASPSPGWGFAGWSGACSGIASSCTVTLNANASAAASFATLFGIGAGPVAALPAGAPALLPPIIAPIPQ
jgi:uncharacterized repeat protein (TIGR03803 family)